MARLEDVATELLFDILDLVPPEDLESASLVSKRVHRVARSLLDEHRKVMREQYRVWDRYLLKENDPFHEHTDTHADLLCTVSTDQRLAKLIQTLRVRNETRLDQLRNRGTWKPRETFPGALPGLRVSRGKASQRTRIQILEEVVLRNDMVPGAEKDVWIDRLRARSEATAVLLLLCKLPALQNLQVDMSAEGFLSQHDLLRMFDRVVACLIFLLQVAAPVAQPCQNLKHIMITFDKSEFVSVNLVRSFLSLPSISSLSCSSLVMNPEDSPSIPAIMLYPLAIKQLRFNDCILNPEALAEILLIATSLESFTYAYYLSDDSALLDVIEVFGNPIPNVHTALPIIASTIGDSLETLVLSTKIEGAGSRRLGVAIQQIDVSQGFRALKRLSVSTNLLLSEDGGDISLMASKLPTGLEYLALHWVRRAPIESINGLKGVLDEFTEQAEAQLISLEHLAVRGKSHSGDRKTLCPTPKYQRYSWHAFGYLSLCLHHACDCTDWDTNVLQRYSLAAPSGRPKSWNVQESTK